MRRLALVAIGVGLAAACSSFDDANPSTPANDGGTTSDGQADAGPATATDAGPTPAPLCTDLTKCPAKPLALKVSQLYGLAIDVDYIYAGSEYQTGKIYRITKSDGTVATLAEGKGNNAKLPFLHGNDVWFGTDNGVFKVAKTGSGGVQQVSPVAETALTFDGDEVFGCHFVPFTTTDVVRVDPADGGVAKLGQALGCESMSANGKYFFFGGSNSFGRKRVDGSDTAVVLGNYSARRVVADGDYVYSITSYDGEVRRIKIEGAGSNTAFETVAKYNGSTSDEGDLTVDATHVYWTIGSSAGKVFRAPKAGGPPELIADNFSKPVGIVVDDHAIYWSERDRDTLWTRQK